MALFAPDRNELLVEALGKLKDNTTITRLTPGSKARALLEVLHNEVMDAYDLFDNNLAIGFLTGAQGIYLDFLGDIFGITRKQATIASTDVLENNIKFYVLTGTFGDINGGNDIIIPAGTLVGVKNALIDPNTEDSVFYIMSEAVKLNLEDTEAFVSADANKAGITASIGASALIEHNFIDYADVNNNTLFVTNVEEISADDVETDVQFRSRIFNTAIANESSNNTAIRLAALSVPGVSDVVIREFGGGIGTSDVYIESISSTVSLPLLNSVNAALDRARAQGVAVTAFPPIEVGIQIDISIRYKSDITDSEKDRVNEDVANALAAFFLTLSIGDSLVVNQLTDVILSASVNIIDIGQPNEPLDALFIYKMSTVSGTRIKSRLLKNYNARPTERVILETSISSPIIIREKL